MLAYKFAIQRAEARTHPAFFPGGYAVPIGKSNATIKTILATEARIGNGCIGKKVTNMQVRRREVYLCFLLVLCRTFSDPA